MEGGPELNEGEIEGFLSEGYPRVVAALTFVCDGRANAEDVVQEALARAWERMDHGTHIDSLQAWVTTVALNLSRNRLRRLRTERRHQPELAQGETATAANPEDRLDVRAALRTLPRRQREVTVLFYYLDMSVADIADALGMKEGTVKVWLHRARASLAAALGDGHMEVANDV